MSTLQDDMAKSLGAANEAQVRYGYTMQVFQGNAQRHDFVRAEEERANLHALLDLYLDAFLAAAKRMEIEFKERR
jgi:hypothetical protein